MKELLKELIRAETIADKGELAAANIILAEFRRSGIDSTVDIWDANRANITTQISSVGCRAALLFICHLDVVPAGKANWQHPAFVGLESDGRIYGRGAADMKGGLAAIVTAIRQIVGSGVKLEGDIMFCATAGEETDSCGAKRLVNNLANRSTDFAGVIIPEPTDFEVITAHRGMLWLKVTTEGRAAHSSTPQLGINAIASMKMVLAELDNYKIRFEPHKLLGGCSMSVNTIAGGKAINVVPDQCSIEIDIRTLPGQQFQDIISDFEKIFAKLKQKNSEFEASVSVVREVGALETDGNCDFVKSFCSAVEAGRTKAVGFTTDGPCFAPLGAPVVIFGPGKPCLCHMPDEYIEIKDLEKAVEYYKNIILRFLA